MLFDKFELIKLHRLLGTSDKTWDENILTSLDRKDNSPFSEYELYGNFIDKEKKVMYPWMQIALKKCELNTYNELKNKYDSKYLSVTFPSYLN